MLDTALSLLVIAAVALLGGAYLQWRRGNRKQAGLMLVLAAVMAANVAIWSVPNEQGQSLANQQTP
jgi:drug/metabolite transporter superfamily protein YnfA